MVEAISSYSGSNSELNEIRKALLSKNSESKLSSKKNEETPKELSKKEVEKEIRLSKKSEEVEEELPNEEIAEEEVLEEDLKIVVNASEIDALNVQSIDANANIENAENEEAEAEYDEEMDLDGDGKVTDEERIRYYSEKYEQFDSNVATSQTEQSFNAKDHTPQVKQNATNPITSNMTLINKMQANYGKITLPNKSGLEILV